MSLYKRFASVINSDTHKTAHLSYSEEEATFLVEFWYKGVEIKEWRHLTESRSCALAEASRMTDLKGL